MTVLFYLQPEFLVQYNIFEERLENIMRDEEVFDYYAPFIKEFIYRNNWNELREVQIEAGKAIFETEDNLLVTAGTASGKTEAVFFPILSQFADHPPLSVGVIYLAPLKSLINDQFYRLDHLLEEEGIPVYHWHGDVAMSHKTKMIKKPSGILQITPESLESMLINRVTDIPRLFGDLRYIIIDEIHTLPGVDRGNQVICQLERLQRLIPVIPRRIGLSATVGEPELIAHWMSQGNGKSCQMINVTTAKPKWRLGLEHFFIQSADTQNKLPVPNTITVTDENGEEKEETVFDKSYEFIYDSVKDKKCLVFSNSREEVEYATQTLRQLAKLRNEDDVFYIHHGDLSTSIREEAELILKDDEKKAVACATVTMELGVDIGQLERIIQLGSPNTIANFLQRLGRSGRRGGYSEMLMAFREEEILQTSAFPRQMPWELLKAIAIIQLYIEEKFIEPPNIRKMPMSLLYHQIMSLIASHGEISAKDLGERILNLSPFKNVPKDRLKRLLEYMLKKEHLQFTEERNLIIGLKGENVINSFKFYAVFKDFESFNVRSGSQEIGTIMESPPVGDRFALAGYSWEVVETDIPRKVIYVKPIEGKLPIQWPGEFGEVHTKILEKIREILSCDKEYPYLFPNAGKRLRDAREIVAKTGMLNTPMSNLGGNTWVLFPWLGTRSFRTLRRFIKTKCSKPFKISDLASEGCYFMEFKMERGKDAGLIRYIYDYIERNGMELDSLVGENEDFRSDKYDDYVPPDLLREAFITDKLNDVEIERRFNEFIGLYNDLSR